MSSLKHLPTKPVLVHAVNREPFIRQQHYKPKEGELIRSRYLSRSAKQTFNHDIMYELGKVFGEDASVKDILNEIKTAPGVLEKFRSPNAREMSLGTLLFAAKFTGDKEAYRIILDFLSGKENYLGAIDFFYLAKYMQDSVTGVTNPRDPKVLEGISTTLTDIMQKTLTYKRTKPVSHFQALHQSFEDGELMYGVLEAYVQHNDPPAEALTAMFDVTKHNKREGKLRNPLEAAVSELYTATQYALEEYPPRALGLPAPPSQLNLYRGMVLVPDEKGRVKVRGNRVSSASTDPTVAQLFTVANPYEILKGENPEYIRYVPQDKLNQLGVSVDLSEVKKNMKEFAVGFYIDTEEEITDYPTVGALMRFKTDPSNIVAVLTPRAVKTIGEVMDADPLAVESLLRVVEELDEQEVLVYL